MEFFSEFPELGRGDLRDFKKAVDFGFRSFSRAYGEGIENFFDPLLQFMIWFERLLINSPWPIILAAIAGLAWLSKLEACRWLGRLFCHYWLFWHVGKHHGHPRHHFGGDLYLHRAWDTTWYLDGQIKPRSVNYHAYS